MSDWCILRTSGRSTISLAESLTEAGFDVWTPVQSERKRLPRGRKVQKEVDTPIMPTFVFARAAQLANLITARALPSSAHPNFSVFRYCGRIPVLADRDIASLRAVEQRARQRKRKEERHVFPVGQAVRVTEGPAGGMSGVVEEGGGKFAVVAFGGTFRIKIATWLLREDEACAPPQPTQGTAALAA